MIKLKIAQTYAFEKGMLEGAPRFYRVDEAELLAVKLGMRTPADVKAFIAGFQLAQQDVYFYAWKDNKNLLYLATRNADVKPIKWEYRSGINGMYIDEVTP